MIYAPALPHDSLTKLADGVHAVRGTFQMGPALRISRTMTILEGADGLVVLNAMRLSEEGETELAKLGPVKHLVKLSESHGVDEPYFVHRYKPEVWSMADVRHLPGVTSTRVLGSDGPIAGGKVFGFAGTSGWKEVAYFVPSGGGTLVTCDSLQHHVDTKHASVFARVMTPMMGFKGGLIVAPMWRKYQKISGPQVKRAFAEVLAQPFANLVTGHGPAIAGGADAKARRAIEAASA
jgi:hypothetical protein